MYQAQRYFRTLELEKVLAKLAEQANCDDSKQMGAGAYPFGRLQHRSGFDAENL